MNEKEHLKNLSDIKSLMERSSRFLSLSGLSGIFIGCYALVGALAAWWYFNNNNLASTTYSYLANALNADVYRPFLPFLICDVLGVLALSLTTGYVLTKRLAKKQGLTVSDPAAKRLVVNLFIPLVAGGFYCLILLIHNGIGLIAPTMLIFYGISLLNASKYTHNDIGYLGMVEIVLGLIAAVYLDYGLLFWAVGFGVMHIIYGIAMYYKYER